MSVISNATASVLEIELEEQATQGGRTVGLRGASAPTIYIDGASRGNPGLSGIKKQIRMKMNGWQEVNLLAQVTEL